MSPDSSWPRVAAAVVTYMPHLGRLRSVLDALAEQTDGVFVVDNSGDARIADDVAALCRRVGAELLAQPANRGLAAGFNAGMRAIRLANFSHVLLMDQDSLPRGGMVKRLLRTLLEENRRQDVAAVVPRFFDPRGAAPPAFAQVGFPRNQPAPPRQPGSSVFETDYLISSGCLLPLEALDRVGELDESLFIDNIDMEWCFRARFAGLRLLGEGEAQLEHQLGDGRLRLPFGRVVIIHGPARLYYIMRNRMLLYRMRHVPWRWKAQDILRLPAKFLIFSLLIPPRSGNIRQMLLGLWHGLAGRTGPRPAAPPSEAVDNRTQVRSGSSASSRRGAG